MYRSFRQNRSARPNFRRVTIPPGLPKNNNQFDMKWLCWFRSFESFQHIRQIISDQFRSNQIIPVQIIPETRSQQYRSYISLNFDHPRPTSRRNISIGFHHFLACQSSCAALTSRRTHWIVAVRAFVFLFTFQLSTFLFRDSLEIVDFLGTKTIERGKYICGRDQAAPCSFSFRFWVFEFRLWFSFSIFVFVWSCPCYGPVMVGIHYPQTLTQVINSFISLGRNVESKKTKNETRKKNRNHFRIVHIQGVEWMQWHSYYVLCQLAMCCSSSNHTIHIHLRRMLR